MSRRTQRRSGVRTQGLCARAGTTAGVCAGILAGFALFGACPDAAAAERNEPLTIEASPPTLEAAELAPVRGLEPRFARDLTWTRLSLEGDSFGPVQAGSEMEALRPPSLLQGLDLRGDVWSMAPGAGAGVATAAASLMTSGLSMFKVLKDGKLRQRHAIRCFFRSGGLKLAWRIEF